MWWSLGHAPKNTSLAQHTFIHVDCPAESDTEEDCMLCNISRLQLIVCQVKWELELEKIVTILPRGKSMVQVSSMDRYSFWMLWHFSFECGDAETTQASCKIHGQQRRGRRAEVGQHAFRWLIFLTAPNFRIFGCGQFLATFLPGTTLTWLCRSLLLKSLYQVWNSRQPGAQETRPRSGFFATAFWGAKDSTRVEERRASEVSLEWKKKMCVCVCFFFLRCVCFFVCFGVILLGWFHHLGLRYISKTRFYLIRAH